MKTGHHILECFDGNVVTFETTDDFIMCMEGAIEWAKGCDGLPTMSATIGPRDAEWLLARNQYNRNLSEINARRYLVDMHMGEFRHSADPILLSREDGYLLSGQHRLLALIESRKAATFNITFGMPIAISHLVTDRGRSRTPDQVLRYVSDLPGGASAFLRLAYFAPSVYERQPTTTEMDEMAKAMEQTLNAVLPLFKGMKRKLKRAPVVAAVLRAWPHAVADDLVRFIHVYKNGLSVPLEKNYEKTALLLRESMLDKQDAGSAEARKSAYCKAQQALCAFLEHRVIRMFRETAKAKSDLFPLTGAALKCRKDWDARHAKAVIRRATIAKAQGRSNG